MCLHAFLCLHDTPLLWLRGALGQSAYITQTKKTVYKQFNEDTKLFIECVCVFFCVFIKLFINCCLSLCYVGILPKCPPEPQEWRVMQAQKSM